MTRVAALGELTASIAHEVNQPLAAVVNNANASLRWLSGDSPNLAEARKAIRRIIRDGNRAGDVISRMRALLKKARTRKNAWISTRPSRKFSSLARNELQRNRVSLQTQFANDLPLILGDRIQLQQVILNLLINAIEAMSGVSEGPRELWVSSQKVTEIAGSKLVKKQMRISFKLTGHEWLCVLIAVRDSGPGLDREGLDRLFDAFYTTKSQGWAWDWRSAVRLSKLTGDGCGQRPVPRGAVFQFMLPICDQRMS